MARIVALVAVAVILFDAPTVDAQQDLTAGVQDLVSQMITSMEQQQKRKLAILDFTKLDGSVDNFGRYVAERLITSLFLTKRFQVIERRQLDKILAELKLNLSDLIDPKNAQRFGRVYGVDAIASGSVSELATTVEVNARLIETETGRVFSVASARFVKDRDVAALLGQAIGGVPPSSESRQGGPFYATPDALRRIKYTHSAFTFELAKIEAVRDEITLTFVYTNLTTIPQRAGFRYVYDSSTGAWATYLADNLGQNFTCLRRCGELNERVFQPRTPEEISMTLGNFKRGAATAKLQLRWMYQVRAYECCAVETVMITDIPLPR